MATTSKTPAAAAAAVLLLLIAAIAVAPASASSLTIYRTRGCRQPFPGRCGVCYNMGADPRYYKGYSFNYFGGQAARLYDGFNCIGGNIPFRMNAGRCFAPYIYNSIRMLC